MLGNLASNLYEGIKDFLGPSVVDGRLNQSRLAFARRCYWIQSQIFRIPDRFGFASGPPRLQVEESFVFVPVVFVASQMIFHEGIVILLLSMMGDRPVKSIAAMLSLLTMALVGCVWADLCLSSRRDPAYVWKDWKDRTE